MSTKRKALALVKPVVKPSAKVATKSKIDETRTAVSTGPALKSATKAAPETIEISSDSSSHYSDSDNEDVNSDNEAEAAPEKKQQTTETKKTSEPAAQQDEASDADENDDDDASPTFGDLARGNATIDVASALAAQEAAAADASSTKNTITLQRPNGSQTTISATSLGTVLNQALRTDDSDLLESCLQTSDPKIITNTITRMDSALAGVLLSKLAARMHRRPGRAFGLMKWIQTTLVAHGGSLVAQPEVVARLGELNRVLEERARGLPALLALKGKLDMLDQQMRWRKFVKQGGASAATQEEGGEQSEEEDGDDVDEPGVVYVEGDEDNEGKITNGAEEDFALIDVGADGESDEEEGDEDEEDEEDDEEFDDAESLDEDEVDHDDVEESGDEDEEDDDEDDDEEDEDEAPPAKVQKVSSSSGKFTKRK